MAKYVELVRVRSVKKPRIDWPNRWSAAIEAGKRKGLVVIRGQEERMIAKEDSPIWKKLAEGAGGFRDAIGEGEPPFAYGSGMGWKRIKDIKKEINQDEIKSKVQKKIESKEFKEELKKKLGLKDMIITMKVKL